MVSWVRILGNEISDKPMNVLKLQAMLDVIVRRRLRVDILLATSLGRFSQNFIAPGYPKIINITIAQAVKDEGLTHQVCTRYLAASIHVGFRRGWLQVLQDPTTILLREIRI
jgi:hypothetical protein